MESVAARSKGQGENDVLVGEPPTYGEVLLSLLVSMIVSFLS